MFLNILIYDEDMEANVRSYKDHEIATKAFQYALILNRVKFSYLDTPPYPVTSAIELKKSDIVYWACQSSGSYKYLVALLDEVLKEHEFRFGYKHPVTEVMEELRKVPERIRPTEKYTSIPIVLVYGKNLVYEENTLEIKKIESYRKESINDPLSRPFSWTSRPVPTWFTTEVVERNTITQQPTRRVTLAREATYYAAQPPRR